MGPNMSLFFIVDKTQNYACVDCRVRLHVSTHLRKTGLKLPNRQQESIIDWLRCWHSYPSLPSKWIVNCANRHFSPLYICQLYWRSKGENMLGSRWLKPQNYECECQLCCVRSRWQTFLQLHLCIPSTNAIILIQP
jgi:hypothetical protein